MTPLRADQLDQLDIAEVLTGYLVMSEALAHGWAESLCELRAAPVPALPDEQRTRDGHLLGSDEGYTLEEVRGAVKAYALRLRTNDRIALGDLTADLKKGRRRTIQARYEKLQDLGRRALPEATDGTVEETRRRNAARAGAMVSRLVAGMRPPGR